MKTKNEMIAAILKKYKSIYSKKELDDLKNSLDRQDDVSIWEVYVKNIIRS